MSYEKTMLENLKMPDQKAVERALMISLFNHNGAIKEFSASEKIVRDIANEFHLNEHQLGAFLETIYRPENRLKKSNLWHRLLFRAADSLAKRKLISRPTQTLLLTQKREWMLTEDGYDEVIELLHIPKYRKEVLPIKTYEVQKIVKKLHEEIRPVVYNPIENKKKTLEISREVKIRSRGFRQGVIEAYGHRCAVCGMKINSPDSLFWEVEAAHIVPHGLNGKDDIWNGISLCRLHHWAFDVGWFTINSDFTIFPSEKIQSLPDGFGKMGNYNFIEDLANMKQQINLPEKEHLYPHYNAIMWHQHNVFTK